MRTVTYAVIADTNAILETTNATEAIQTITNFGSAVIGGGYMNPARTLTVTTSADVGGYVAASTVVVTGRDANGAVITETFTITDVDGNEVLVGTVAFSKVDSVVIAAQAASTGGAFIVGVQDIVCDSRDLPKRIRIGGTGNLKVKWGSAVDLIPSVPANQIFEGQFRHIVGDSQTTVTNLTLFF